MFVHDSKSGKKVQVEVHGGKAYVANRQGHLKERKNRFNEVFWGDMQDVFEAETLSSIDHLRPLTGRERFEQIRERYGTYEGQRGSANQWRRAAEALLEGVSTADEHLTLLGLSAMPADKKTLTRAWHKALKTEHPDIGGSVKTSQLINDAYEKLLSKY